MPLRRRGGSGTGGGGLLFRTPPDEFTAATRAAAETARDAAITDTTPFDDNPSLAITLNWPATPTNTVWQVRRSSSWADVTPAIRGPMGLMGDQARFTVSQFRAVASNAIPITAPTGGSYVQSTGVLTSSTGWSTTRPTPASGQVVVQSDAPINPATDADTVTPTWSVPFEPLDEGVALRTEAAETDAETAQAAAETAQAAAETALAAALVAQAAAESAETDAETAQTRAEAAQSGAETALASSGAALAFNELWTGDLLLATANQWHALGTEPVPANATWLLWNGGTLTDGSNDGPAALWTWINAADWRELTADTVGTTAGDGTGMLFADWCASDIGDGTPDFTRRDAVIGRTSADIPLLMGPQTGESYFGARLMYITQAVATPGGGGGASSFSDLSGMIADSQVPDAFTRDTELASLLDDITVSGNTLTITLQDGSTETRTIPGMSESQINTLIQTALAAAVTSNTETGITVTHQSDGTFDFVVTGGGGGGETITDDIYFGTSSDETPTGAELTIPGVNGVGTIPTYTGDMRILIARLATEGDITEVYYSTDASQTNQIGTVTKFGTTVVPTDETEAFNVWVGNQPVSNANGVTVTVR